MKWFVLKTKQNSEIKVAENLNRIGIKAFCPVVDVVKQYSDRRKKVQKPALPSYVLVNIPEKSRPKVFSIPGVVKYLFWLGKPALVRQKEIDTLINELNNVYEVNKNFKLIRNNNHTLNSGPLKGHKGKILNISNNKFKLELKDIGVFVTVNLA